MSLLPALMSASSVIVRQRSELAELIGFETRNKYEILSETGQNLGFAAEQGKGFLGAIARHFMGHFRRYEIAIFDSAKQEVLRCVHPFRWYFHRLEVKSASGEFFGAIQHRFGIFRKRFTVEDATGQPLFEVSSPLWKIWTFPFTRSGTELAKVEKKWSGGLSEIFTDRDNFKLTFSGADQLDETARALLLASSLFIDLQYFERKAG